MGSYERTTSFFENSPMKASGEPAEAEKTLLTGLGVPASEEALGPAYLPPKSDGSGQDRNLLMQAGKLLDEAGFTIKNGVRFDRKGQPFTLEILTFEPVFERVMAPYVRNLKLLPTPASAWSMPRSTSTPQGFRFRYHHSALRHAQHARRRARSYFGSAAAKMDGSLNLAGIADPVVDALIERILAAKSRDELEIAARALDRVLRAGHYWVPHWYKASSNVAYWDKFSRPEQKPRFDRGILDTWWYDEAKAAKLAQAGAPPADSEGSTGGRPWLILAALIALMLAAYFVARLRRSARTE